MKKRIAAILACTMALAATAGCGGQAAAPADAPASASAAEEIAGTDAAEGASLSEETETLKIYMPLVGGGATTDVDKVEEAINAYIEPKIHANIDLTYIPFSQWSDQMNMAIASGEQVDAMATARGEVAGYYKNGALLPLDDLIAAYGEGITEYVDPVFLSSCTFGGEIYGIPTLRDMAKQQVFEYSVDVAEKYGLEMKETMTLDELEEQFLKLKEQSPTTSAVLMVNTVRPFESWCAWDALSDSYGVVMMGQEDLQLTNLFETEEYHDLVSRMQRWFEAGIINPEAPTSDTQWADIIPTGNILGRFARSKPGYEEQETLRYSTPLKVVKLMDPILDTSQVQFISWAVPVTCKYPEKTVALLNLFYSDPYIINLMSYGIEGEHYVVVDEENSIIDYPEGIDTSTTTFNPGMNYAVGNEMLGYIWAGNEPDIWDQLKEFNTSAKASPTLGFAFDNSNVVNEISACNNVLSKYAISLEIGAVDVETVLPQFQQELRDAGIEKIIAEKQAQIDAWAAANAK